MSRFGTYPSFFRVSVEHFPSPFLSSTWRELFMALLDNNRLAARRYLSIYRFY